MVEDDNFIGAYIELSLSKKVGGLDIYCGWDLPNDLDPELIETFKNLAAGIFGLLSCEDAGVAHIGKLVRAAPGFDDYMEPGADSDVKFTPDEDLLATLGKVGAIDLSKFNPTRKH